MTAIPIDIDECAEGSDGCVQSCTNTVGSYECSCTTGYRLASDDHRCNGMQRMHDCTLSIRISSINFILLFTQMLMNVLKVLMAVAILALIQLGITHVPASKATVFLMDECAMVRGNFCNILYVSKVDIVA